MVKLRDFLLEDGQWSLVRVMNLIVNYELNYIGVTDKSKRKLFDKFNAAKLSRTSSNPKQRLEISNKNKKERIRSLLEK